MAAARDDARVFDDIRHAAIVGTLHASAALSAVGFWNTGRSYGAHADGSDNFNAAVFVDTFDAADGKDEPSFLGFGQFAIARMRDGRVAWWPIEDCGWCVRHDSPNWEIEVQDAVRRVLGPEFLHDPQREAAAREARRREMMDDLTVVSSENEDSASDIDMEGRGGTDSTDGTDGTE